MALHLSPEYREGQLAAVECFLHPERQPKNPYGFFAAYTKHYAWDIGFQTVQTRIRAARLPRAEEKAACKKGEEALFRLLFPPPQR